jgi:hypothetical protein
MKYVNVLCFIYLDSIDMINNDHFHDIDNSNPTRINNTYILDTHHQPIDARSFTVQKNPLISDDSGHASLIDQYGQTKSSAHFVVVAIDFGTTYSGYAFAFTRDLDSILMMRKVDGNDPGWIH